MKFSCYQKDLATAVTNVQRAVSPKTNLPALEGILIRAIDDKIILCGYDLEIGITTSVLSTVQENGSIVVSAKLFAEIIRRLPDNSVSIETDEKAVVYIHCGCADYQIVGIPSDDYPELPVVDAESNLEIESGILRNMIKQTIFAISDDNTKPIYTGSLFEIKNKMFRIVSIDGYRVAIRQEAVSCDTNTKFIVPGKTLSEILKLTTDSEQTVQITVGQRHAVLNIGDYSIITRLIEGNFIDYRSTIPETVKTEFVANTREFISAVERMSLLNSDRIQSPIKCMVYDTQVNLSCSTSVGKANDTILAHITGENVEIGLNNRYLLDALKNSDTDRVKVGLNGAISPIKITPVDSGEPFIFLVVPMRFKS